MVFDRVIISHYIQLNMVKSPIIQLLNCDFSHDIPIICPLNQPKTTIKPKRFSHQPSAETPRPSRLGDRVTNGIGLGALGVGQPPLALGYLGCSDVAL